MAAKICLLLAIFFLSFSFSLCKKVIEFNLSRVQTSKVPFYASGILSQSSDHLRKQIHHFNSEQNSQETNVHQTSLRNLDNNQYFAQVSLGSDEQKVFLLLDTGSTLSTVLGSECQDCNNNKGTIPESNFNCTQSVTCKTVDKSPFTIKYVQGSATGYLTSDKICLQNDEKQTCSALSFAFLLITEQSQSMENNQGQGILGLGIFPAKESKSLIRVLHESYLISEPSFSLYLSDTLQDHRSHGQASKIILGGIDSTLQKNPNTPFTMHNLANDKAWALTLQSVKFGEYEVKSSSSQSALIDSGTSLIVLPREDFNALLKYLNTSTKNICHESNKQSIACSCPTGESTAFPNLKIKFGSSDQIYSLEPREYIKTNDHLCDLQVSAYSTSDGQWILGDPFLRKYYSLYHLEKKQIGLSEANQFERSNLGLPKDVILILEGFLGAFFLGLLVIYLIRMISGLKNTQDQILTF